MKLLNNYLNDPYNIIKELSISDIEKLIKKANNQYYNYDNPIMSDEEYDLLKNELEINDPNNKLLFQIGNETHSKDKVELPYFMPSMDKLKPNTNLIDKWTKKYKGPYIISDKLDGTSALLNINKTNVKLYTRGNGKIGTDISQMLSDINGIPKINNTEIVIRGELIISKKNFNNDTYTNSRAMVNGLVGKKKINKKELELIDFVSYELIKPKLKPSEQFEFLTNNKFNLVNFKLLKSINEAKLKEILKERKLNSKYDIDGIIILDDNLHNYPIETNPKYSFAFKELFEDQIVKAEVIDVNWNLSKDGYIKPRVNIKPIKLGGITIRYLTGHNAKYIIDNGIGIGTIINITRAGEVIPYILKVLKKNIPSLPKISYKWNETKVDFILDENNSTKDDKQDILVKNLSYFFKKMNIKNIDEAIIRKMLDVKLNSIKKIINASINDFMKIEGFKDKMSKKIFYNISNGIKDVELHTLMNASNIFGHNLGDKKLKLIVENIPDIISLKLSKKELLEKILEINGFSDKTANQFINNLDKFKKFIDENDKIVIKKNIIKKTNELNNIKIVFTGIRDKNLEEKIESKDGKVINSISKNVDYLIIPNSEYTSSKIDKAKNLNIKIIDINEFKDIFKNIKK